MSDEPTLPTEQELKQLPLRAMVAYAVRCARRVQGILVATRQIPDYERHVNDVETALHAAESFCVGQLRNATEAVRAAAHAASYVASVESVDAEARDAAKFAMHPVYAAFASAQAAAHAASSSADDATAAGAAYDVAHAVADAYGAARASADAIEAARPAARREFDYLSKMELGDFPELGQTIDPSENGPLGPFWP